MTPRPGPVLIACCLLVATVASLSGVAAAEVTVASFSYGGTDVVGTPDRGLSIWQSDDHEFTVRLQANESHETTVCLSANASDGPRQLGCRNASLAAGETRSVTVDIGPWPGNLTGARTVSAVVSDRETGETLAERSMGLTVLGREADLDGDGLVNEREAQAGTNLRDRDTDNDTLSDALEVRVYDTSATDRDSDADGLGDGLEIKTYHTDPLVPDTDDDGIADGREVDLGTNPSIADTDGDGLVDGPEVNTYQTDPASVDTDDDGLGDGAEVDLETNPTQADTDGDGLTDGAEVNLYETDPTRADTDGDGIEDATEIAEFDTDPTAADSDGDGLDDGDELREYETDPLVADTDRDGLDDGLEVELGSNPTDPTSTADPGPLTSARIAAEERPLAAGLLGAAVVIVVAGVLAWRFDRFPSERVRALLGEPRESDTLEATDATVETKSPSDGDQSGEESTSDATGDPVAQATTGPVTESGSGGTASADADSGEATSTDATTADTVGSSTEAAAEAEAETETESVADLPDDAVLTNEERVARLLDENGGRMLQSDMVEAADWSKATVSRVLTRMEEAGEITRVDIGRGNLVARPGDEPESAGSPFSESDES
jgi:hypothetical protein